MNLILVEPDELAPEGSIRVDGRRLHHVRTVLRAAVGDVLRLGVIGGRIGRGVVLAIDEREVELAVELDVDPPPPSPVTVVLALPRPPVLRRVLQQLTTLGVKRIVLLHAHRVESSYWTSSALAADDLHAQLVVGLEQACDTVLPEVSCARRFRPFVEDVLPGMLADSTGFIADPAAARVCPTDVTGRSIVVVGPEGGFVPFEVEALARTGMTAVSLGPRVLRSEVAAVAALARLGSRA